MVSRTLDFLLLGVAILRADVLPRWAGLLLIIGILLVQCGVNTTAVNKPKLLEWARQNRYGLIYAGIY